MNSHMDFIKEQLYALTAYSKPFRLHKESDRLSFI